MKRSTEFGYIVCLIVFLLIVNSCEDGSNPFKLIVDKNDPVELNLSVFPSNEGNFADVILTVKAKEEIKDVSGEIILPEGLELVSGDLHWKTDLNKKESKEFKITTKSTKEGVWGIKAVVEDSSVSEEVAVKADDADKISIYMTEEEWRSREESRMNDSYWLERYYRICNVVCYVPNSLKGDELNNYFKSLNLTDNYIYVMIQFDVLGADPFPDQVEELEEAGVTLLGSAMTHTYYAKVPREFLENENYDYIRWIGIMSPEGKLKDGLLERINHSDKIDIILSFHHELNEEEIEEMEQIIGEEIDMDRRNDLLGIRIDANKLYDFALLSFVKRIDPYIPEQVNCENPAVC